VVWPRVLGAAVLAALVVAFSVQFRQNRLILLPSMTTPVPLAR